MDIPARKAAGHRRARSQARSQQRSAALAEEACARAGIKNRERRSRLKCGYSADGPSTQQRVDSAGGMLEEWKLINVADRETMRTVEIGNAPRCIDVALIVIGRVDRGISGGSGVYVLGKCVGGLKVITSPAS